MVDVNQSQSGWFDVCSGVKQECTLSPLLFALCIDDLVENLNQAEYGISFGDCMLSDLLYADDTVLNITRQEQMSGVNSVVQSWCKK